MTRGKLPLGIQNFEELRKGGYLYADKTDMVWQIANGDKYNFLSRPRRFGKSLLVSTLQCYFEGKKELFEGLKIMELEKDWIKRPVIHFSMNLGGSDAESLYHYLDDTLTKYEEIYGKRATEATLSNRFTGIIERAYQQSGEQVAVLVDEYDAPLQHSYLTDRHEKCRNLYRDFFTGLKDYHQVCLPYRNHQVYADKSVQRSQHIKQYQLLQLLCYHLRINERRNLGKSER